jgi:hypothetical protein
MIWWDLPGPKAFITAVVDDVRQGKSVFLHLPEHSPKRLSAVFRNVLGEDLRWFSTALDDCAPPVEFLYELLVPYSDPTVLRSPHTLVAEPAFQTHLIWLEGLSAPAWPAWLEFFLEYASASRNVAAARKTHFLVPWFNTASDLEAPEAIGLSQHSWDDWLRYGDMLFYSCARVGERATPLETELTVSLVAELAAWDPELCEWLARFSLEQLTKPRTCLSEFCEARGWNANPEELKRQGWMMGTCHTVKGRSVTHSCLLSSAELDRLIWKAEITVLMPYIEEQRQNLLKKHQKCLAERINNPFDLEIGQIEWQLIGAGIKRVELEWVSVLKEARNSLSHLEPVDAKVLASILGHIDR